MSNTMAEQSAGGSKTLADMRGVGKQVARAAGGATVQQFFEQNKAAIGAVLPKHMTPERMVKIALRCLRVTPKLMDCTLDSLMGAVITCAQLGLEPNTPQGHIYLIPFKNTKKGVTEVQVIIGYKGLIDLARRSGEIESISARVVYDRDEFAVDYGTDDRIIHKPYMDGDAGDIRGFYAVAKLRGGGTQFEFMPTSRVNVIRDGSQGYIQAKRYNNSNPWISNYDEMGRKTLIRRLTKYLPMSIELAGAVSLDERGDRGVVDFGKVLEGVDYTSETHEPEEDGGVEEKAPQLMHEQTIQVDLGEKPKETVRRETKAEPSQAQRDLQAALERAAPAQDRGQQDAPEKALDAPSPKMARGKAPPTEGLPAKPQGGLLDLPSGQVAAHRDDADDGFGTGE